MLHKLSNMQGRGGVLEDVLGPSRTSSRTHFEVLGLGLEGQVLGLGLEASSPRKLACPRLEDSTIFWIIKILWSAWKILWKTFFRGDRLKNFCEDLFLFFEIAWKIFVKTFFFSESTCACVLGPWPWPRAFLSLASRVSVLGKADLGLGLGLGFFLCPWPRALCPRPHLWCKVVFSTSHGEKVCYGSCSTTFKARWYNHAYSFWYHRKSNVTELSKAVRVVGMQGQ